MFCLKEEILQNKAAESLAELIYHCIGRKPSPNDKLIKNLCTFVCMDPCETPQAGALSSVGLIEDQDLLASGSSSGRQRSKVNMLPAGEDRSKVEGFISRRGSELALKYLCTKFGGSLFDKLPKIWHCLVEVLKPCNHECLTPDDEKLIDQSINSVNDPQILINNIQVIILLFIHGHIIMIQAFALIFNKLKAMKTYFSLNFTWKNNCI